MTLNYAEVIGDPIAHSKSPVIHRFWLEVLGIAGDYRATRVSIEDLPAFLTDRRADPAWRGCNVTMPHKSAVVALADELRPEVRQTAAANTLVCQSGALIAANTDIDGILSALPSDIFGPGDEVCIIGSGGAARAALAACKRRNVGIVLMSSRKPADALALLKEFGFGGTSRAIDDAHNIQTADVIINATPLGMAGREPMPQTVLSYLSDPLPGAAVLDMVYSPLETEFLMVAKASGCRVASGLEMLIGQAAVAFELFFGAAPPRERDGELRALLTA